MTCNLILAWRDWEKPWIIFYLTLSYTLASENKKLFTIFHCGLDLGQELTLRYWDSDIWTRCLSNIRQVHHCLISIVHIYCLSISTALWVLEKLASAVDVACLTETQTTQSAGGIHDCGWCGSFWHCGKSPAKRFYLDQDNRSTYDRMIRVTVAMV